MVELCFVLDLRSLPPPFLRDLKQSLLQLANLYVISPSPSWPKLVPLRDRIGLCFVFENPITSSEQLKIVYTPSPSGNFCLRDFHDAVNGLPDNAFRSQMENSDVKFSTVDEVLYHWGGTDIMRKVIVITSCLPRDVDFIKRKSLTAATDKCVSVEFVLFKHTSAHPSNVKENIKNFATCISELDNCSFQTHLPDPRVLHGLVNRWLQDLKDDIEEPLQARFNFKKNLVGSVNHISCNLYMPVNQVVDCFCPSQIDVGDYDSMLHERGSHQLSNMLVKESLQFGLLSPNMEEETYESNATQPKLSEVRGQSDSTIDFEGIREETSKLVDLTTKEDKTSACSTEEWEQLVVNDVSEICSPLCTYKPMLDQSVLSPQDGTSQLDAKNARILERSEMPRQFGREPVSPNLTGKGVMNSSVQVSYMLMIMIPICIAILAWKYFITLDAPVTTTSPTGPHSDCLEPPVNIVSFAARHFPTATPSPTATPLPAPSSMCVQCCPPAFTLGALITAIAWGILASIVVWAIFFVVLMVWTSRCWMKKDFEYWIEFIDGGWKTELKKMIERQTEKRRKLFRTAAVCLNVFKFGSFLFFWGFVALYVVWPIFQMFHVVGKWEAIL